MERIYLATKEFPKEELYGLTSQMRRCAVSIPSNISEGFSRGHRKEYVQFLSISLGSCAELTTQLEIATRLRYLDEQRLQELKGELDEISRMTMGLIKKIRSVQPVIDSPLTTND